MTKGNFQLHSITIVIVPTMQLPFLVMINDEYKCKLMPDPGYKKSPCRSHVSLLLFFKLPHCDDAIDKIF